MAKAKSKFVKVLLESIVTQHQVILVKLRTLESLEVLRYDPMLGAPSLYREKKKISSYSRLSLVGRYVLQTQSQFKLVPASNNTTMLIVTRGLKKLGYGRYLSVERFRARKGLPQSPTASGPITDDPDWSYPDGTPGQMTKGQSDRYIRDQNLGRTMVEFNKQFEAIGKKYTP